MTPLYAYSLIPVLSVSLLLFFSTLLYGGRAMLGLTLYCGSIAAWSGVLLASALPGRIPFAPELAQIGAFVAATFLHAAYDLTEQRRYGLLWAAYLVAAGITATGIFWPGLLYSPTTLSAGPAFWPSMLLALGAAVVPLWQITRAYPASSAATRAKLRTLALSGVIGFVGAWVNAVAMAHGLLLPYPMLMVLASLLILTALIRDLQRAAGRRLLERSLLYAALTALLSAGFLFGVFTFINRAAEPLVGQYQIGALFLLFMAALAVEPLRQQLQRLIGRGLLGGHAGSEQLAQEVARLEQRADQSARLAELGRFVSAVAHEVRNPLGVIQANLKLLERRGLDDEAVADIREQVERASRFVEDLLHYGRPRQLELRTVDLVDTIELARSTAVSGAGVDSEAVAWEGLAQAPPALVEADQGQLTQLFVILFDNAILSLREAETRCCRVSITADGDHFRIAVDDSGPGIPAEIAERLFEPFATARKREGSRSGTGLGLAIARNIVQRHQGSIAADRSPLGGARFIVELPRVQKLIEPEAEVKAG